MHCGWTRTDIWVDSGIRATRYGGCWCAFVGIAQRGLPSVLSERPHPQPTPTPSPLMQVLLLDEVTVSAATKGTAGAMAAPLLHWLRPASC